MKRLFLIALALVVGCVSFGFAEEAESFVALDISSCQVTGNEFTSSNYFPCKISTAVPQALITKITITNRTPSVGQQVRFYQTEGLATSTANVKCIWEEAVGGSPYTVTVTSTIYLNAVEPTKTVTFADRWLLKCLRGLMIQKSSPDSVVDVAVQYR